MIPAGSADTALAPGAALPAATLAPRLGIQQLRMAVLALLCLLGLAFQGSRSLWDPDEGRYSAVALQMLESGDWLVPRLNDHHEHLTKPPLAYWTLAASFAAFGSNAWAARLPGLLAYVLTGLLVFELGRRFVPRRPWLPAWLWATSLLPLLAANVVNTDALLALFETFAVYAWLRSGEASSGPSQRRWLWLMWLGFALGFLTKGPPALLPLLPLAAWTGLVAGRAAVWRLCSASGLLTLLLVGGGWFLLLVWQRPALLGYFLGYELVQRIFTDAHDRNGQWYGPLKIYLPVLLLAALPWLLVQGRRLARLRQLVRLAFWRGLPARAPQQCLLLLWLLLPLLAFCLIRSRLYLYLLPLAVPLLLLLARDLDARVASFAAGPWPRRLAGWTLLVLLVKAGTTLLPSGKDAERLAAALQQLAGRPERILFLDESARYGLRFYSGIAVEQVGTPPASSLRARGEREHDLCEELRRFPGALVVTAGSLIGNRPAPPPPSCGGRPLRALAPGSGAWMLAPPDPASTAARPGQPTA